MSDPTTNAPAAGTQPTNAPAAQPAASSTTAPAAAPAAQPAATEPAASAPAPAPAEPAAKDEGTPPGAPDKYDFKQPETGAFDSAVIDAYSTVAKELNLPLESAQKILDAVGPVMAARQAEHVESVKAQWATDTAADKELGGDTLAENVAVSKKALEAFATPEFIQFLDSTGLGNHPEMVRTFFRAGKAISEDTVAIGANNASKGAPAPTAAQRMYPNMNP